METDNKPDFDGDKKYAIASFCARAVVCLAVIAMVLVVAFCVDGMEWMCAIAIVVAFLMGMMLNATLHMIRTINKFQRLFDKIGEAQAISTQDLIEIIDSLEEDDDTEDENDEND